MNTHTQLYISIGKYINLKLISALVEFLYMTNFFVNVKIDIRLSKNKDLYITWSFQYHIISSLLEMLLRIKMT